MNTRSKNRLKGKQHRVYHRVSTYTPDQHVFVKYLTQRGYTSTLKAFQQQLAQNSKLSLNELVNVIHSRENVTIQKFKSMIVELRALIRQDSAQFIKLQFLLNVWYCSHNSNKIPKQKASILRNYIQKNGVKLSQFPQLLPYFALPYIQQPLNHPFLCKIYTPQWKQEIKKIAINCCQPNAIKKMSNEITNQQNQWFTVVKDLIQICMFFDKQSTNTSQMHIEMIQRVKKYQKVIEQNDNSAYFQGQSIKPSELSRLLFVSDHNPENKLHQKSERSIEQVSSAHENILEPLSFISLKQYFKKLKIKNQKDQKQLCLIFYALHERIKQTQSIIGKKYIINQYIENDILLLNQPKILPQLLSEIQSLKFINTLCFVNAGINYLSISQSFINILCKQAINGKDIYIPSTKMQIVAHKDKIVSQSAQQKLLQVLSILQKISFKKEVFMKISKTDLISNLVVGYLPHFQILPTNVLTYILALILNVILHREGKLLCSSMKCPIKTSNSKQHPISLFQLMIKIWNHVLKMNEKLIDDRQFLQQQPQFQLQSLVYSIFYVLLGLNSNKKIAKSVNFKEKLIKFMSENNDQYHIKIGKYMMEVLQSQQQMDGDEDQQRQQNQDEQLDNEIQHLDQIKGLIWIGDKLIELSEKEKSNIQVALEPFYQSKQKKQVVKQTKLSNKINENIHNNLSQPIFPKSTKGQSNQQSKQKKENKETKLQQNRDQKIMKNFSNFDQASGYDPSKYQAWKRLKTNT